jgi:uncharacterized protein (DUF2252 family)
MARALMREQLDRYLSADERKAWGRALREEVPRTSHATWEPPPNRRDPVSILEEQIPDRISSLIPLRHFRMSASPFAFYRGTAEMMADDLSSTATTGMEVQACGDAHLANFGLFGSPERSLVFDLNDFDETHPGPWEWDVKRLAASAVLLARDNGWTREIEADLALTTIQSYRTAMADFAGLGRLDMWYSNLSLDDIRALVPAASQKKLDKGLDKARANDRRRAIAKFTEVVDGRRRIVAQPPTIQSLEEILGTDRAEGFRLRIANFFGEYLDSLPDHVRPLVLGYRVIDIALKVVGVGSVGTRCLIVLVEGRDPEDLLLFQIKEAQPSALAPFVPPVAWESQGHRVVTGQRLTQYASDIFLGWARTDRDFYLRQFRDMKGSINLKTMIPAGATAYLEICGWTLARAHSRTGDRISISAYMGRSRTFDRAVVAFARAYADQAEADFVAFTDAIASGRLQSSPETET